MKIENKICLNCGESFLPSKNDIRIKFCCAKCRIDYRNKTNYMNNYYKENTIKWKDKQKTDEYKNKKNEARRLKYATDENYRKKHLINVKKYYENNPDIRLNQRMRRFGITAQDYKNMIEKQDYKCAICGSEIGDSLGNRLYVDHNHKTGKVRGLLCSECNFGIGKFKDNISILKKAVKYLEENDGTNIDMV